MYSENILSCLSMLASSKQHMNLFLVFDYKNIEEGSEIRNFYKVFKNSTGLHLNKLIHRCIIS